MKRTIFVISLALAMGFVLGTATMQSQPGRCGYGMGPGMMGGWYWVEIPSKLPAPKSAEWVQKLSEILTMETQ